MTCESMWDTLSSSIANLFAQKRCNTGSIFKWSLTGLNSEFSFSSTGCRTKVKEFSLPYYLSIAGRRIIGFIPFSRVLSRCEMQTVSSRIQTCVALSVSYDSIHYTTNTSFKYISIFTNPFTLFFFIIQCVKTCVIPCPHQSPTPLHKKAVTKSQFLSGV